MKLKILYFITCILVIAGNTIAYAQQNLKVARIKKEGKWGMVDSKGKIVVEPLYDELHLSCSQLVLVSKNMKYGYLNLKGKVAIPIQFQDAGIFYGDFTFVKQNGKYGFIDESGKFIIPPQYEEAKPFINGYATVKNNGKWGVIDTKNKVIINFQYDAISNYESKAFTVKSNNKTGLIDIKNNIIIPIKYHTLILAHKNLYMASMENNGGNGYVDTGDKLIVAYNYNFVDITKFFLTDYYPCLKPILPTSLTFLDSSNLYGFFNLLGQVKAEGFKKIKRFQNNYLGVCKSNLWGMTDTSGNEIIPLEYEDIGYYSEGKIPVKKNNKWGFVDLYNKPIIDFNYQFASEFYKNRAIVISNKKIQLIDQNGKVISDKLIDFHDENIEDRKTAVIFNDNFICIRKKDKWGAIDYNGKLLILPILDKPIDFDPTNIYL